MTSHRKSLRTCMKFWSNSHRSSLRCIFASHRCAPGHRSTVRTSGTIRLATPQSVLARHNPPWHATFHLTTIRNSSSSSIQSAPPRRNPLHSSALHYGIRTKTAIYSASKLKNNSKREENNPNLQLIATTNPHAYEWIPATHSENNFDESISHFIHKIGPHFQRVK